MRAIAQTAIAAGFFCWVVFELAILSATVIGERRVKCFSKRRPPNGRPSQCLSVPVPRTVTTGLIDTALHSPTRPAAVPCIPSAAIIIVVITPVVIAIANANMDGQAHRNKNPLCCRQARRISALSSSFCTQFAR